MSRVGKHDVKFEREVKIITNVLKTKQMRMHRSCVGTGQQILTLSESDVYSRSPS